jgi:UDP-glucose 4-epimerase
MNKKVALVGGSGFIGQNLTNFFLDRNYEVIVASRKIYKPTFEHPSIVYVEVRAEDTAILYASLKECETIIWLVSSLVPSLSNETLVDDFDSNISPLIRFLEIAKTSTHFKRFVYLSSGGTIYGDSLENKPFDEDSTKKPISSYGLSKIVTENYIKFLTSTSHFQSFILRPSNVYGKFQNLIKPQGIIGYAFKSIINNSSIDLYDDGRVTRDFIHVNDLSNAVHSCMKSDIKESQTSVYNVGSQKGYTIKEILGKINSTTQMQIHTNAKASRNFDCNYNVLKIEKIKRDMNWEPKIEIEEGLKQVWEWIKNIENGR